MQIISASGASTVVSLCPAVAKPHVGKKSSSYFQVIWSGVRRRQASFADLLYSARTDRRRREMHRCCGGGDGGATLADRPVRPSVVVQNAITTKQLASFRPS